ncbi:MAG: type II secretion system F family protein [Gammaproteobacteria bacterium]|nr:type II secretion system F family protein [Gammaproteobacteria bacterium]
MAGSPQQFETFVWEARDPSGSKINGEITALNPILAKAELRQRNIHATRIKRKPKPLFNLKDRIKQADMGIFSRQLSTMIDSGVPVVQALDIISSGTDKPSMQKLLEEVRNDVAAGSQLAHALAKHGQYFDHMFCNLIHVGEESGTLDTMLNRLADYQERMQQVKSRIRKALAYPVTVLMISFILTVFMLVKVVPQFESLYASFGGTLPLLTRIVVQISEFMQQWWLLISLTIIAAISALVYSYKHSLKTRIRITNILMRLPILGGIVKKAAIARFARTLSTMFSAGVPLVTALETVAEAVDNEIYRERILAMRDSVATGEQLQSTLRQSKFLFPNMVTQMIAIGEESGSLDNMLGKIAEFYEEEVNNTVDTLSTLMEPIIMLILGVVVGGLVLSMYLPIFDMGSAMHR